jgi:hypothetical protein
MGMFAPLSPEAIEAGRREALIDLVVGAAAKVLILLFGALKLRLNSRASIKNR